MAEATARLCDICGAPNLRPKSAVCSKACSQRRWLSAGNSANIDRDKACEQCGTTGTVRYDGRFCSRACGIVGSGRRYRQPRQLTIYREMHDLRSPLRVAFEDGSLADVRREVRRATVESSAGCWEWQRQTKGGYAIVRLGRRELLVHRMVMGNPSEPVVHHVCANRKCVNPDHLQLVTQRDNIAEMLERNHYLQRIAALEEALRSVSPFHPALSA